MIIILCSVTYSEAIKTKNTDTEILLKIHVFYDKNENNIQDNGEPNAIFAKVGAITPHGYKKKDSHYF